MDSEDTKCESGENTSKKILDALTAKTASSLALCQRIEKKVIAICGYQVPAEGPRNEQGKVPGASDFSSVSFRRLQEIDDNLVRASAALRALDKFI